MYIDLVTLSNQSTYAPGLVQLTEEQFAMYIEYNGFIKVTSIDPVTIEPDTEAWEAWKAQEENKQTEEPLDELTKIKLAIAELASLMETKEV